jgi:hypothetical protein
MNKIKANALRAVTATARMYQQHTTGCREDATGRLSSDCRSCRGSL